MSSARPRPDRALRPQPADHTAVMVRVPAPRQPSLRHHHPV